MSNSIVYMVTFDGYFGTYGSEEYLLGIFSSLEEAEAAAKKYVDFANTHLDLDNGKKWIKEWIKESYKIRQVPFGEALPLTYEDSYAEFIKTKVYLGGYVE